jgi:hypothetical protein
MFLDVRRRGGEGSARVLALKGRYVDAEGEKVSLQVDRQGFTGAQHEGSDADQTVSHLAISFST